MKISQESVWLTAFFISPLVLHFFDVPAFEPKQVIYDAQLLPLLLAPLNATRYIGPLALCSRLLQMAFLSALPSRWYYLWLLIAAVRIGAGFLFTRALGWVAPALFFHSASYEPIGGVGPILAGVAVLQRLVLPRPLDNFLSGRSTVAAILALVVLDNAPWSYAIGAIFTVLWIIGLPYMSMASPESTETYELVVEPLPQSLPTFTSTRLPMLKHQFASLILRLLLFLVVLFASTPLTDQLSQMARVPRPLASICHSNSSSETQPLLNVLIVTAPRWRNTSSDVLSDTIASFIPIVASYTCVDISVYTHFASHDALDRAKNRFASYNISWKTAENGTTEDIGHIDGQHLHVARSLQWVHGRAEWTVLVEDDFPLCGEWGIKGLMSVMDGLHRQAVEDEGKLFQGFVGTGGSGLMIHNSLLPLAASLLLTQVQTTPSLASASTVPPDIVLQDCLLATNPICAPLSSGLYIPSRMVMHHVGGNLSTTDGVEYPDERWACGWRHVMHGKKNVEVVWDKRPSR